MIYIKLSHQYQFENELIEIDNKRETIMRIKTLVAAMAAVASLAPIAAQAQAQENPWMVRVRAVDVLFQNGQSSTVQDLNLKAQNRWIPEFDVSYFFTKNIAAELVLTWPQQVNIYGNLGQGQQNVGKITALPPSLLAQYHFTDLGAFKPYVGAGVNYTIFGNRQNFVVPVQVEPSSVGFVGQVGMDYMLDKNWGLNVDVKYATMATNVQLVSGGTNLGKLTLNPWMPAVGVTYKF